MLISFNGVIAPYLYNCPHAHRLRNIEHVYPPKVEKEEGDETSKRMIGIRLHEELDAYLRGDTEQFEHTTDLIESLKHVDSAGAFLALEQEWFFDTSFNVMPCAPEKAKGLHYIYMRPDAVLVTPEKVTIFDWKFGNSNFGASRYYAEVEWFLAGAASKFPDTGEFEVIVHFPIDNYSLPSRVYDIFKAGVNAQANTQLVERILRDRLLIPNPSKARCYFCDYRSTENGGCGKCEESVR